jgi:hypothetical protein
MKNQFSDAMSKRSDSDLLKIVTEQRNDFQPEAIIAAEEEIDKRKLMREQYSKFSDEQLLEFLKSRKTQSSIEYHPYEAEAAKAEADKRNLLSDKINDEIEKEINNEIVKLGLGITRERYPALRFMCGLYRFLAFLFAIASIICFIYAIMQEQMELIAGAVLVGGGFIFISFLAIAEGIQVFIDIERNTRISAVSGRK